MSKGVCVPGLFTCKASGSISSSSAIQNFSIGFVPDVILFLDSSGRSASVFGPAISSATATNLDASGQSFTFYGYGNTFGILARYASYQYLAIKF